jgi:hypothetical protein
VSDWELAEARKKDALDRARVRGEEPPAEVLAEQRGLHYSVEPEVKKLLEGKTRAELEDMQAHIESEMRTGAAKLVEYWETVLKHLRIYKAKVIPLTFYFCILFTCLKLMDYFTPHYYFTAIQACLKEIHAKMLRKHLHRLEKPSEGEDKLEDDHVMKSEEDIEDHVQCITFMSLFNSVK